MIKKIFSKEIFFLPLLLLTLFVSVNKVSADTTSVYVSNFYSNINVYSSLSATVVSNLTDYYTANLQNNYDYYYIYYSNNKIILEATNEPSFYWYSQYSGFYNSTSTITYYYDMIEDTYSSSSGYGGYYNTLMYYTSTDFILKDHTNCSANISSRCIDEVQLPMYSNLNLGFSFPQYNIIKNYVLPTYTTLVNGTFVNGPTGTTGSSGLVITDIFTNPIKTLESVWSSIVNIFNLIGEFIALIPSPLKEFLISAFMLAIILGILKILL